ncbi:uncharacterized protein LOC119746211 isoform X2 [Patiria miniata]|uniref:Shugoshin C-terminal domain-containing protein n=1 Tax=Patiria miniata TaxID=46514 RepID=A0A914BS02_PATMI|nr:uncharacterized protein LOC119746211 isoform X2 [Patiria miniata]
MATESTTDKDKDTMSHSKGNTSIELIKEKMKEKRRKKALNDSNTSWSRSFSKRKGTTASYVLKASLRSNNQSLAKALAASKHDAQQAHQNILELQRDRQFLLQQANSKRMAEKECIQRFGNIKQVLSKVTHSLLDGVSSLGQAIDLCSSLPLRESSLGLIPRASLTSDDDSFRIVQKADQGQAQLSSAIESAASHVMQAADTMATATINQSEPSSVRQSQNEQAQGTSTSEELKGSVQSEPVCDGTSQSASSLIGVPLSDKLKDLANEELDLEFPSLDDLDIPLRFIDETPDSKVSGSSNARRQSSRLEPPVKRSRTATLLTDPIAIQKALAEDADYTAYTEDPDENNQTVLSPEPEQGFRQTPSTTFLDPSPSINPKNQTVKSTNKRPAVKSRRATYNISPVRSEAAGNKTFEVSGSPQTPGVPDQQTTGVVKERYVFIHTPPGNVSNYKTMDMELTGVTNNSTSTQDEQNKSLANKSRFNHDEQVIRPWGNIHMDKPKNSPAAKVNKQKNKTKPPTNTSKSLLPKPQKKISKESGKILTGKGIKKAGSKKPSKKTCLMSESFRNDLAVFDLSAGDSFSLAPPIFNRVKSKTTDALAGFTGTNTARDAGSCFDDEKSTEIPIVYRCPEPMPQGEQLQPITDSKPNTDRDAGIHSDNEKSTAVPSVLRCSEPMPQGGQLQPFQQEELLDSFPLEEHLQAESLKLVESVKTNRGSKIKRKSKKAKSVESPGVDKMTGGVLKAKPNVAIVDSEVNDIFEGTCLAKMGNTQPTTSWQPAEDINDAIPVLTSNKPTKRRPTKEKKVKVKSSDPPKTEILIEDTKSAFMPKQHPHKTLSTDKAVPFVTFNLSSPAQMTNDDGDDILGDIDVPSRKKKSTSPSSSTVPISTSKMDTETRCSPPSMATKNNSQPPISIQPAMDKASSSRSRRGQKRMADALKEEPTAEMEEEGAGSQETGRTSRRAGRISYKEPSLRDKMRNDHSSHMGKKKATQKKVKKSKRAALETVTNVT